MTNRVWEEGGGLVAGRCEAGWRGGGVAGWRGGLAWGGNSPTGGLGRLGEVSGVELSCLLLGLKQLLGDLQLLEVGTVRLRVIHLQ